MSWFVSEFSKEFSKELSESSSGFSGLSRKCTDTPSACGLSVIECCRTDSEVTVGAIEHGKLQ